MRTLPLSSLLFVILLGPGCLISGPDTGWGSVPKLDDSVLSFNSTTRGCSIDNVILGLTGEAVVGIPESTTLAADYADEWRAAEIKLKVRSPEGRSYVLDAEPSIEQDEHGRALGYRIIGVDGAAPPSAPKMINDFASDQWYRWAVEADVSSKESVLDEITLLTTGSHAYGWMTHTSASRGGENHSGLVVYEEWSGRQAGFGDYVLPLKGSPLVFETIGRCS